MRYSEHEALVAPARETAEIWRTIVGFLLTVAGSIAAASVFMMMLVSATSSDWHLAFLAELDRVDTPRTTFFALMGFTLLILSLAVVLRVLHKRSIWTVFGPFTPLFRDFYRVAAVLIALYVVLLFIPSPAGGDPVPNLAFSRWIIWLPFALLAVVIQVSAEELVFRGYVQSQLAARFSSPLVWMVAPSLVFAIGHYSPETQGANAWLIVIWAAMFGLIAADLTARSGNLGPAIALHLVNNASAILLTAPMGPLSGLALYTFDFDLTDVEAVRAILPLDFAIMVISWLGARVAIRA